MKTSHRKNSGFTLLEIMLVVIIIGLLVGLGVKLVGPKMNQAREVRALGDMEQLKTGLLMYQSASKNIPTNEQGLKALVTKPEGVRNWRALAEPGQLVDPWGKDYIYVQPGVHNPQSFDLFSSGPDMIPNTDDDIPGNWDSGK